MKDESALFGVAGNPPHFWESEFRSDRANAPEWLNSIGLDALEIQCTYGVRMPQDRAIAFRANAEQHKIQLSVHAPYYIGIGSSKKETIQRSIDELRKALDLSHQLGSKRIIFHPGSIEGDRESARKKAVETLKRFEDENNMNGVSLFPEIAGKIGALGSLEDVITICENVACAWPCLDLAHLHAREHGSLRDKKDFQNVFQQIESRLGTEAYGYLHLHMYPVEWGDGGEITHKAFHDKIPITRQLSLFRDSQNEDTLFRPRYEPLLELVVEQDLKPTIICEAKDSQDVGAREMKNYYSYLVRQESELEILGSK